MHLNRCLVGRMPVVVLTLLLAPALTSCGGGDGTPRTRCAPEDARPITGNTVESRLSAAGYEMIRRDLCTSVTIDYLQNRSEQREELGHLICTLSRAPIRVQGKIFTRPTTRQAQGEEPEFYLQNVRCALYVRGDEPERQIAAFESAFATLAGD